MTHHLFGSVITECGVAANNRGETDGNISQLQKISCSEGEYTTVSAEAIRFKLRYLWQKSSLETNRTWDDADNVNSWKDQDFKDNGQKYIDDDVLGFMNAKAAGEDNPTDTDPEETGKKRKSKAKGTSKVRRGALEISRAISLSPFYGDITFNAASGAKDKNSLYATEVHRTRYQYSFGLTPGYLNDASRILPVINGIISLGGVAGNQSRFFFDFSPEIIVLRWTHDMAHRFMNCFAQNPEDEGLSISKLLNKVKSGDIDPDELWIGGTAPAGCTELKKQLDELEELGAGVFAGVKAAADDIRGRIQDDLDL